MRHYLYLEDRRIAYVCGCFKGGVFTLRAAKTAELTRTGDVQEAAAFLRSAGLAGKSVIAAVGGSETVLREMRLPAASAKITRGMIRNEIAYFRRTAAATAVDMDFLERAGRGKEQHLLAYAMERERLEKRLLPLKEAGISCARLSVLPDCMAKFALRMGARRQTAVVAALESDQLRLCLVKDGHCLLNRNVRLNVRRFCDAGAEGLLYEEIADQIGKLVQFCEARTESETVQQVLILPGRLKDADAAAASVGGLLRLRCRCLRFDVRPSGKSPVAEEDIHFSAMVLCAAHRPEKGLCPVNLLAAERGLSRRGRGILPEGFGARCLLFAAANALAVAGIWCYLEAGTYRAQQKSRELSAYLAEDKGVAAYREKIARHQEQADDRAYQSRMEAATNKIRTMKCLTMEGFEVLEDCLAPGMDIQSVVYNKTTGYLSLRLTIPDSGEAPGYVERVRDSGYFTEVEYSSWGYGAEAAGEQTLSMEIKIRLTGKEGRQNAVQ